MNLHDVMHWHGARPGGVAEDGRAARLVRPVGRLVERLADHLGYGQEERPWKDRVAVNDVIRQPRNTGLVHGRNEVPGDESTTRAGRRPDRSGDEHVPVGRRSEHGRPLGEFLAGTSIGRSIVRGAAGNHVGVDPGHAERTAPAHRARSVALGRDGRARLPRHESSQIGEQQLVQCNEILERSHSTLGPVGDGGEDVGQSGSPLGVADGRLGRAEVEALRRR